MKYITVPVSYAVYALEDESYELLGDGRLQNPPYLVLEVMVLQGQAKRVATLGMNEFGVGPEDMEEEDEDVDLGDESPWPEDHE